MIYSLVVLVCFLLASVSALPQWHHGKFHYGYGAAETASTAVQLKDQLYVNQSLDHFDRANTHTFAQRYFVSTEHWKGSESGAPVFLCVGGEGPPLDRSVLVDSVHCTDMVELAAQTGALMFALEHRYYGPSNPFGRDFSTENLRWLNTEQALGDLAHFIALMNAQYALSPSRNRWVTWGGSYPGMLAGLTRLRYPHLVHAAVASSAPLQPSVDMPGYNNVVAHSIAAENVGGSKACLATVTEGHKAVGELLASPAGRRELEKKFNLCKPLALEDERNREFFAGDGVVMLPVQTNDPACTTPNCNIASVCATLTDESIEKPIDRLAALSAAQNPRCVAANYEEMLALYANPSNPERSWLYQTCTEWGFYQTCETGTHCPYTQGLHTLDIDLEICKAAFGISAESVYAQIANTEAIYGGRHIQGSRILFPNGEIDPWFTNSVLVPPNAQEPTLWIKGASHHFWTHKSLPTDSPEVVEARQKIWAQVKKWLQ